MIAEDCWETQAHSVEQTLELGRTLGRTAFSGAVLALIGTLGAGKTTLCRGIVAGLAGNPDEVSSPTFVLVKQYAGRLPIAHFDTYRLRDVDEFLELGTEEFFEGDGVCLIEWADRVHDVLPVDHLRLEITAISAEVRSYQFRTNGEQSRRWLTAIQQAAANLT